MNSRGRRQGLSSPMAGSVSGCMGKKRFDSFTLARSRAAVSRDGRKPRVAYRCSFCGGVHIGERDVTRERAERRLRRELEAEAVNALD